MPRKCTICTGRQALEIDRALCDGETVADVAKRFKVSRDALHRHRRNGHVADAVAMAAESQAVANGGDLLTRVQNLERRTMSILDRAEAAGSLGVALASIREARSTIELLAKLVGDLDTGGVNVVIQSPGWVEVRAVVVAALEHHPEARAEVAAALEALNTREAIS